MARVWPLMPQPKEPGNRAGRADALGGQAVKRYRVWL